MLRPDEEKSLVIGLKRGSIRAFEKLLLAYEKGIFNYLYRLTGNRADTEDLTQETFIKLFDHRQLIDPERNFRGWLFAIATNSAYDLFRKRRVRAEVFIIDDEENPFETINERASYKNTEVAEDIAAAIQKLKPLYRAALLLYYKNNFSYEEISHILILPLNTVKTRISRAKTALKKQLGKDYYG